MLELYDERTGKPTIIYAIEDDSHGYPKFLIRKDNRWIWESAKHYITIDERKVSAYNIFEQREIDMHGIIRKLAKH